MEVDTSYAVVEIDGQPQDDEVEITFYNFTPGGQVEYYMLDGVNSAIQGPFLPTPHYFQFPSTPGEVWTEVLHIPSNTPTDIYPIQITDLVLGTLMEPDAVERQRVEPLGNGTVRVHYCDNFFNSFFYPAPNTNGAVFPQALEEAKACMRGEGTCVSAQPALSSD